MTKAQAVQLMTIAFNELHGEIRQGLADNFIDMKVFLKQREYIVQKIRGGQTPDDAMRDALTLTIRQSRVSNKSFEAETKALAQALRAM